MSPRCIAFIPVRQGSKSIPGKNIKPIAGRPLVHWAISAADGCAAVDRVVVSTDSPDIERIALASGAANLEVHRRSAESATDTASTESVMLEYARAHDDFDVIVLIQATSPMLTSEDISRGLELIRSGEYDSVLSVVRQKRFIWDDRDGGGRAVNYDPAQRPRRQDFDGFLVENGAFYIVGRTALLASECRVNGRVGLSEMSETSYFEIDEPADWAVAEVLLERTSNALAEPKSRRELPDLSRIRALFTDCDGVLTDGGMYYSEQGDELKRFQTRDGMGFARLRDAGIIVGIITSESVGLVRRRAAKLQLDEVHCGITDKLEVVSALCEKYDLDLNEVAYIGDDVLDLPVISAVGLGCSVSDGMPRVKDAASYVTEAPGGSGAFREVADLILEALRIS